MSAPEDSWRSGRWRTALWMNEDSERGPSMQLEKSWRTKRTGEDGKPIYDRVRINMFPNEIDALIEVLKETKDDLEKRYSLQTKYVPRKEE